MAVVKASVIVPTRNRHALLADTLGSLNRVDVPAVEFEVIVVDDGSQPPVVAPEGVALLRHVHPRGLNAARNTGARAARSDLMCFVDDDVELPPEWLREMLEAGQRHPETLVFTGKVDLKFEGTRPRFCDRVPIWSQFESELDFGSDEVVAAWCCGANLAIRREAFDRFGGFREDHPLYYEENEWIDRLRAAGSSPLYIPAAALRHRRVGSDLLLRTLVRRAFRRGYGEAFNRSLCGRPFRAKNIIGDVARVPAYLGHSLAHRCWFGLLQTAFLGGKISWILTGRRP